MNTSAVDERPERPSQTPDAIASHMSGTPLSQCFVLVVVPDDRWLADTARDDRGFGILGTNAGSLLVYSNWNRDPVHVVRAAAHQGVEACILLEAGQLIAPTLGPALTIVADHINLSGQNPLMGPNQDRWGVRFPDMTEPYDIELRAAVASFGAEGIMAGFADRPNQDDLDAAAKLGADVATRQLVAPAIAARHAGLRLLALVFQQVPGSERLKGILEAAAAPLNV